jgi:Ser/Thr protein kinase RdoA (MazF antagonist)
MSAMMNSNHSFAGLTPERVLDALCDAGVDCDGRIQALNSYENRVYLVGREQAPSIVAKFYRPDRWSDEAILEEHAFAVELASREIPVVAPLPVTGNTTLGKHDGYRFGVFPMRGGRAPELDDGATLEWIGRYLGRIHAIGATKPFRARPKIDIETFGVEPSTWLLAGSFIPPDLHDAYRSVTAQAIEGVRRCFDRAGSFAELRLHGDCHAGNILWTDEGPHFVDFDDCRTGPAIQDLWMLLSGERKDMTRQLCDVLAGYEDFHEFDPRELFLVEALRTLRMIHYSAWLARRWEDPAFPMAFPWFNTQRYWQDCILALREQIALMDEPPLSV